MRVSTYFRLKCLPLMKNKFAIISEFPGPFKSHNLHKLEMGDEGIQYPIVKRNSSQEVSKRLQTLAEEDLRSRSNFVFAASTCCLHEDIRCFIGQLKVPCVFNISKGWETNAADATPRRCRRGANGGLKASSTSTPEAPPVCMRQRPGAGGWEKKCRGLGTRNVEGQRMLNGWPHNMMNVEHNTYSIALLPPLPIQHDLAGPGPDT